MNCDGSIAGSPTYQRRSAARCVFGAVVLLLATVSRPHDVWGAGVVGNGVPSSCTEAGFVAALAGGGLVTFNCGNLPLVLPMTITKVVSFDTTVDGGGKVTLDGRMMVQVFVVTGNAALTLRNLAIERGKGGAAAPCGSSQTCGGAVYLDGLNTLTVSNCAFRQNTANFGAAIFGGAGTLIVDGSVFEGNEANGRGGAIDSRGTLTVRTSTFRDNLAISRGGAITQNRIETASMHLIASSFLRNRGTAGGALDVAGEATMENSTFWENTAYRAEGAAGGGILALTGDVSLTNCTLAGNGALVSGQPVPGAAIQIGTRASGMMANTIIGDSLGPNCLGIIDDGGHNLQYPGNTCGGTIRVFSPRFDPAGARMHGGPTDTVALLQGSRALNVGDTAICESDPIGGVDQRAVLRFGMDTACDIGAVESSASPPLGCPGDCDIDNHVVVEELLGLINTGTGLTDRCSAGDLNNDNIVTGEEFGKAIRAALNDCAGS